MALTICTECGKEISDKAKICPHCGCPVKKQVKIKINHKNKKYIFLLFPFVVIVIISVILFGQNEFSPYLKYIGKSYKELPDSYEYHLTETMRINSLNVDDMFGIPCKFEFMSNIANSRESSENVEIIVWMSNNNKNLTENEINTVKNRLVKLYGDWDKGIITDEDKYSEEEKEYIWENFKGHSIVFSIAMDKSSMSITWYDNND